MLDEGKNNRIINKKHEESEKLFIFAVLCNGNSIYTCCIQLVYGDCIDYCVV